MAKGLNTRQKAFCREYIKNNFNGTQAAIKSGYSKKTARTKAAQLLALVNVQNEISKQTKKLLSKTDELTLQWLQEIRSMAFASVENKDSAVMKIEEITDKDGEVTTKVTFDPSVKNKALDNLGKYLEIGNRVIVETEDTEKQSDRESRKDRIAYLLEKQEKRK